MPKTENIHLHTKVCSFLFFSIIKIFKEYKEKTNLTASLNQSAIPIIRKMQEIAKQLKIILLRTKAMHQQAINDLNNNNKQGIIDFCVKTLKEIKPLFTLVPQIRKHTEEYYNILAKCEALNKQNKSLINQAEQIYVQYQVYLNEQQEKVNKEMESLAA